MRRHKVILRILIIGMFLFKGASFAAEKSYDPLKYFSQKGTKTIDLTIHDKSRKRDIPVLIYLPVKTSPAPVVVFSHGLGGSRNGNAFMGRHWAERGYVAVFLQHPGSDTSVLSAKSMAQKMKDLKKAAGVKNFMLRVKDVPAILDELTILSDSNEHELSGRLDMKRIGMSGHSFGAVTTQAVSGQAFLGNKTMFTDSRIRAAIAFSQDCPKRSGDSKKVFGKVKIPWLLMTGTKDVAIIGDADLESRLAVFPALPAGSKYEVVLYNAEHSAFTERALPGDKEPRNPNHHKVMLALSTAFWDAYLREDSDAKAWLDGQGPFSVLEEKDRWQKK